MGKRQGIEGVLIRPAFDAREPSDRVPVAVAVPRRTTRAPRCQPAALAALVPLTRRLRVGRVGAIHRGFRRIADVLGMQR